MTQTATQFPRQDTPRFEISEAVQFAREKFGMEAKALPLPSYFDQNFHILAGDGDGFVLKIANASSEYNSLQAQNAAMAFLAKRAEPICVPEVCETPAGERITQVQDVDGKSYYLRMLTFLRGQSFSCINPHSPQLLYDLGCFLGRLDRTLLDFEYQSSESKFIWDLKHALGNRAWINYLPDKDNRMLVSRFFEYFEMNVVPRLAELRSSTIHGDVNDNNVIIVEENRRNAYTSQVAGIIDFGDLIYSHTVFDLAIAGAYVALYKTDPLTAVAHVVRGFYRTLSLTELELELLFFLLCTRLCVSVIQSAYHSAQVLENSYLLLTNEPGLAALERLDAINPQFAHFAFRKACGLEA